MSSVISETVSERTTEREIDAWRILSGTRQIGAQVIFVESSPSVPVALENVIYWPLGCSTAKNEIKVKIYCT